jgi:hypothetical protein
MHSFRLLLDPDPDNDFAGGVGGVDDSQNTDTSADLGVGDAPPDLNPAPTAAATQAAEAHEWQTIRDAAKAHGMDLSSYADDAQAFGYLISQAKANQEGAYYAALGRQLAPHAAKIQAALAQPQEPAKRPAWEPPAYNKQWMGLVERDPATGVYVGKHPNVPAEIIDGINARAQWEENFAQNPAQTMLPLIEERAGAIAEARVQAAIGQIRMQEAQRHILGANADWLYAKDSAGRMSTQLSPLGNQYAQHVRALEAAGVTDPYRVDEIARSLTRADVYAAQQQSASGGQQTQFATGRPNTNPLQALPPQQRRSTPAATEPSSTGLSLRDVLARNLEAAGVSDDDFRMVE